MTGEENPHAKGPNHKLTTMIKNGNAQTAEQSYQPDKSDRLAAFSINEDALDDDESVTSEQAESKMLQKIGFGGRASREAPQPSFKLPAQKPIAKSNRISKDQDKINTFEDLAL